MVKVAGKPVVGHIVDRLLVAGIDKIIVNLHYLPEKIPEYLGDKALYYYEPVLLGHDGTIKALRKWLQDDMFFVINGDTLSDIDYKKMLNHHKPGTITVYMDAYRAAGVFLYDKEYFTNSDLPINPYRQKGSFWMDIGTPERLEKAQEVFK